jgi:hypothetical protein
VRAVFVVVPFVLGQDRGRVPLVEDEDPVQQFAGVCCIGRTRVVVVDPG